MEWTVARATIHNSSRRGSRGAILDGTVQGGEGIIGKAGRERGVFVAWSFFTVMSVRRSSSFLVRVSSTSHSSDDG